MNDADYCGYNECLFCRIQQNHLALQLPSVTSAVATQSEQCPVNKIPSRDSHASLKVIDGSFLLARR